MSRTARRWRRFWSTQSDPHYGSSSDEHLQGHARELAILLSGKSAHRVLEIGCGNGTLFAPLGFDRVQYTGVDFSASMLTAFKARHPGAALVNAAGETYRDENKYDLIFGNQIVQYFDREMLEQLLGNGAAMLAPGGRVILGSIPWRGARFRYHTGELRGLLPSPLRMARNVAAGLLRNGIGHWYQPAELVRLGRRYSLKAEVFGSLYYPYRFHVRMTASAPV